MPGPEQRTAHDQLINVERPFQQQDLRLLRSLGTLTSRGLVAGIFARNPSRSFDTAGMRDGVRQLMGLAEGEQHPLLPSTDNTRDYAQVLQNYGLVSQVGGVSAAGIREWQLVSPSNPDIPLAVLGHVFNFVKEYPHLPLEQILTAASKDPSPTDSTTNRAHVITTLVHEYRRAKEEHREFMITLEELGRLTGLSENVLRAQKEGLMDNLHLLQPLKRGYRLVDGVDREALPRGQQLAYDAIRAAEARAKQQGTYEEGMHFTDKELKALYVHEPGAGTANDNLARLAANKHATTVPRGSMTLTEDAVEALEAMAYIINGTVAIAQGRPEAVQFIQEGKAFATDIFQNPATIRQLLETESARNRQQQQAATREGVRAIVEEYPGLSLREIYQLFQLNVQLGVYDASLRFFNLSTIKHILYELSAQDVIHRDRNNPSRTVQWFLGEDQITPAAPSQPAAPEVAPVVEVPAPEATQPTPQPAVQEPPIPQPAAPEPEPVVVEPEPEVETGDPNVFYRGLEALEQVKAGKPAIIFGEFTEVAKIEGGTTVDSVSHGAIIAADNFTGLRNILTKIVSGEEPMYGEFAKAISSLQGFIGDFQQDPISAPKVFTSVVDTSFSPGQVTHTNQHFIVINGRSSVITEQRGTTTLSLKRADGSTIPLRIVSPLLNLVVKDLQGQPPSGRR